MDLFSFSANLPAMSLASTISDDKPWRPYLVEEKEGTGKIILRRVPTQGERKRQTGRGKEKKRQIDRQRQRETDRKIERDREMIYKNGKKRK